MTGDALGRPHHTGVEVVVRLGAMAEVTTSVPDGYPLLEIVWGSIAVLVMPNNAFHGTPIAACDVDRARDLRRAAEQYLDAMEALWALQQAGDAPDIGARSPPDVS